MAFTWEIQSKGIGPFSDPLRASLTLSNSRVVVYAGNGQGKTSISRMFRLAETNDLSAAAGFITKGHEEGAFSFSVEDGDSRQALAVNLRNNNCTVDNSSNYLFHVFNTDYVADNLEARSFSPSGEIDGYIVGKVEIDLTEDKTKLEELKVRGGQLKEQIESAIEDAKAELRGLQASRVSEFKQFDFDSITQLAVDAEVYDEKISEFNALSALPEDATPLSLLSSLALDIEKVDCLIDSLSNPYERAKFAESFLEAMQSKTDFIKLGLELNSGEECPYCGQNYDASAHALIKQYNDYLNDEENVVKDALKQLKVYFASFKNNYVRLKADSRELTAQFSQRKNAFAEYKNIDPEELPAVDVIDGMIDEICGLIESKIANISLVLETRGVQDFAETINGINELCEILNKTSMELNGVVEKSSSIKTVLKKTLCIERAKKLRNDCGSLIEDLKQARLEYGELRDQIREKESQAKRSKREAVARKFSELLHQVFGTKYSFDEERFLLMLADRALGVDAAIVLSDGEKRVVAFCHYVATTYELLNFDDDKARLFFVIDDPISSMDFHHVYGVLQIIRNLQKIFDLQCIRVLLFTHNSAFFNMLVRNKVSKFAFILSNGELKSCSNQSIAPYAEHLKDIAEVANGAAPVHTTGNSIRQTIEALWRFEDPSISNLQFYLNSDRCSDLSECEYIYSLCQDSSHGATVFDRIQESDPESVRRACIILLDHIHKLYHGQLVAAGIVWPNQQLISGSR